MEKETLPKIEMDEKQAKPPATCCSKIKSFFSTITVEPAYLIFSFAQGLYLLVASELYISKVCKVNLAFGEEVCENLHDHKDKQIEVQQYVATLQIYNRILQAVPSVIFSLFAGPWSDIYGRKFLIIVSLSGFFCNNAVFMACTYWFYELRAEFLLFEVNKNEEKVSGFYERECTFVPNSDSAFYEDVLFFSCRVDKFSLPLFSLSLFHCQL